MKKNLFIFFGAISCLALLISIWAFQAPLKDYSTCMKKTDTKWGEPCTQCTDFKNSYRITLRNTCTDSLDVKCAVREKDNKWRIFTFLLVAPSDSVIAYACNGVGRYLVWSRKAGDRAYDLPSDNEITTQYTK